eukprot:TRINITY_DN20835_c0_g1_i2.p1 TRINITY_DN20835_c0_g1~~TRINITY_DN20835_c0_g1_i2.p1  ORF type:complete len:118 (+),score=44.64 TRINITY_DN20835_c0_g1_i2:52-405(+)
MYLCFFFFKQKTAYEMLRSLVGSEMCIRDSYNPKVSTKAFHLPRDRVSPLFSPSQFGEKSLVVLSRVNSKQGPHRDIIAAAFEEWRTRNASLFSTGVPVYNNVPSTPSLSRGAKRPR